jgi:hypothetical protein
MKRLHAGAVVLVAAVIIAAGAILLSHGAFPGSRTALAADPAIAVSAWSVGVYTGSSPFHISNPPGVVNPVIKAGDVTDLDVDIVAHPFMIITDSMYYMFYTAKNGEKHIGGIGLSESRDGFHWKYRRIVIDEPYDLSYPFVFKWKDDYYMIPEAHTETALRLYRATRFPDEWVYERDLLSGEHYISATLAHYKDMWWMFVARPGNETLRLFYASDFKGKWTEHPKSPIVEKDLDTARPGGRPIVVDGVLYRIGQDCYPTYGNQAFAYRITEISTTDYKEEKIEPALVAASKKGWNAESMHHVDLHQIGKNKWIAAVDAQGFF